MTEEERAVASLIWTGRVCILLSFVLWGVIWLAVLILLIYPLYVVIYWQGIRVRRVEVVILVMISLALVILYVRAMLLS